MATSRRHGIFDLLFRREADATPPNAGSNFFKIRRGGILPTGEWQRISELLTVVGIQFQRENAVNFCDLVSSAAKHDRPYGLRLEFEPSNLSDPNAIKVIGWCSGNEFLVGYVDRSEAAIVSEKFPDNRLAAEFYDLYRGKGGHVDIRYYLSGPKGIQALPGKRCRSLFLKLDDELTVVEYAARPGHRLNRAERELLVKYVIERANDLGFDLTADEVGDITTWVIHKDPTREQTAASIDRIAAEGNLRQADLVELVDIFLEANGLSASRKAKVRDELGGIMRASFSGQNF